VSASQLPRSLNPQNLAAMHGGLRFRFYMRQKTSDSSFVHFLPFSSISCVIDSYSIPYHADVSTDDFSLAFYDCS